MRERKSSQKFKLSKNDPDYLFGRFLGWIATGLGFAMLAIAFVISAAKEADLGLCIIGWIFAGFGWLLVGVSSTTCGKDRAEATWLRRKLERAAK